MEARLQAPTSSFKLPRRGHFFAAQSAKKRSLLAMPLPESGKRSLWVRRSPAIAYAVNITGDGRLLVAAYSDGIIRWHRLQDGAELLAFCPLPDRTNWIAWTPEGFYAATAGAQGVLRWLVNRGWDEQAETVPVEDIPGSYRPEVISLVLQELETPRALGLAGMAEHNREVMLRTSSRVPPGTRLHVLAVGISAYNDEHAKRLQLQFADRDARLHIRN
jgi:hypothetical protein